MKKLLTLTACLGLMSGQCAFAQMIQEKIIQSMEDISRGDSSPISHLPAPTAAAGSSTSHLPPLTLIQPVSRIVTTGAEGQEAIQYETLTNRAHVAEAQSQAAKPYSSEYYAWGNVASSYDEAAKALQKATSATTSGNDFEATLWSKTSKQYQESAEYHTQAAKDISNGNKTDYDHFSKAGHTASWSAHLLEEAFSASEKVTQAKHANQEELALLWLKISELNQESSEYNIQAARAISSGNEINYDRFERAGFALGESALRFQIASMALEKAIQAREINQNEFAASLLKAEEQYQESAKYYSQAANASLKGNKTDFDRFEGAAAAMERDAKRLEEASSVLKEATQAAEENQKELAAMCNKTVEQYQQLSEYCTLSTSAFASRNDDDYNRFNKEKDIIWRSAGRLAEASNALKKAVCAMEENEKELASQWLKTTDYYRQAASRLLSKPACADEEQGVDSINDVMSGNDALYNRFLQMARSSEACADQLELSITAQKKAVQATEANQERFASLWLKNAKQHEEAVEYYRQAVIIGNSVDYKWDEALDVSVKNSAERLEKAADAQEQAIQAKAASQEEGAALWLETVKQWQESSEYACQAAHAAINKNEIDLNHFYERGISARHKARALESQAEKLTNKKKGFL